MSLRDKLGFNDKFRRKPEAKPEQPRKNPPKPKPLPQPESVTYKCGHSEEVRKLTNTHCKECKKKNAEVRRLRRLAQRVENQNTTQEQLKLAPEGTGNPRIPGSAWRKWEERGRLPDGANFTLTYNAEKEQWLATLRIPVSAAMLEMYRLTDESDLLFEAVAPAAFRILSMLDNQYRKWLRAMEAEHKPTETEEGKAQ